MNIWNNSHGNGLSKEHLKNKKSMYVLQIKRKNFNCMEIIATRHPTDCNADFRQLLFNFLLFNYSIYPRIYSLILVFWKKCYLVVGVIC